MSARWMTQGRIPLVLSITLAAAAFLCGEQPTAAQSQDRVTTQAAVPAPAHPDISGRELFTREWLPDDARSHGGDGLGPVFNDSSCVACHNQGGEGGSGPANKNVDILSAALNDPQQIVARPTSMVTAFVEFLLGTPDSGQTGALSTEQLERRRAALVREVEGIHPGFGSARSVVVHKFAIAEGYEAWRLHTTGRDQFIGIEGMGGALSPILSQPAVVTDEVVPAGLESTSGEPEKREQANQEINAVRAAAVNVAVEFIPGARVNGSFTLSTSQRNPIALFGAGLIDSIPTEVLEEAAKTRHQGFPEVTGRVARLPDGRVGRYGWKAQQASLYDFTLTACAVELGLNVPEHPQSGLPSNPTYKPAGFDLNQQECDALVDYLRKLPAPTAHAASSEKEAQYLKEGARLFASVGCASCHLEKLGRVEGIYSDLLLHDMGQDLGDNGNYGVFIPDSPGGDAQSPVPALAELEKPTVMPIPQDEPNQNILGAGRLEWRTPPLWGVRDSAPYLHDGRAKTLEQAIAFHGGEGIRSARGYFLLSAAERFKVQAFLKSLVAPQVLAQR